MNFYTFFPAKYFNIKMPDPYRNTTIRDKERILGKSKIPGISFRMNPWTAEAPQNADPPLLKTAMETLIHSSGKAASIKPPVR